MAADRADRARWAADAADEDAADEARTARKLHALYGVLLRSVKAQLAEHLEKYADLSFSQRLEVERLRITARDIASALGEEAAIIGDNTFRAGERAYLGIWYAVEQVENIVATGFGLDKRFIRALVNSPVAGATFSERLHRNRQKLAKVVNDAIAHGITQGRGYAEIARRVSEAAEAAYRHSLTIVRTEAGRVRTDATQRGYDDAAAILGKDAIRKRWMSTLDARTRDDHRLLDGQVVPVDGMFTDAYGNKAIGPRRFGVPSEDINCRCTTVMDVDGVGPEARRDNLRDGEIRYQTFVTWSHEKMRG